MAAEPQPTDLRLADLVDEVNRRLRAEKIRPTDARAKAKVTARTVHHYLDKGLLPAARRVGGQLRFSEAHVDALMNIKRRQAQGLTLDEIRPTTEAPEWPAGRALSSMSFLPELKFQVEAQTKSWLPSFEQRHVTSIELAETSTTTFRWHVSLGNGLELSGDGKPPGLSTIESIRNILTTTSGDPEEETQ